MKAPTMEELFATMPDIPEGFKEGCMEYASPVPIFYRRRGKYADCICGRCAMPFVREEQPTKGEKTNCPYCKTEGVYEWKKCTNAKTEYYTVVLVQRRTDNNLVLRHFKCINEYKQGAQQKIKLSEQNRQFANLGDFWKFNKIWSNLEGDEWGTGQAGITYADILYPGYQEEIEHSNLKYFKQGYDGFIEELRAYARNPAIELYRKIGLKALADELVSKGGRCKYINRRGKNLKAQLRLKDKQRINRLISMDGGITMLRVLQIEEKRGIRIPDEVVRWVTDELDSWDGEKRINHLTGYMTITKLFNRLNRYVEEQAHMNMHTTLRRYDDYITMREELGYDMSNSVFLFPKDLAGKHQEMVEEKKRRKDEIYLTKQEKRYGKIRENFEKLAKKYDYSDCGYIIRPARSATEIIEEGRTLHHCVGTDRYLNRHSKGETAILFLRRKEEPETPYYTIEIKGDRILQWYSLHDKKPDREVIEPFLNRYMMKLKERKVG